MQVLPDGHFLNARLKVERAKEHIGNLQQTIQGWVETHPYKVVIEGNRDIKQVVVILTSKPPQCIPLIAGDAIHNLASAMDHLAWQMVGIDGGDQHDRLQFPRCKTSQADFLATTKGHIKNVRPETLQLFMDAELYPGGKGESLYSLTQFDVIDKHLIIPTVMQVGSISGTITKNGKTWWQNGVMGKAFDSNDRAEILQIEQPGVDIQFKNEPLAGIEIFLSGSPFWGQPIVETLKIFMDTVTALIERFTKYLLIRDVSHGDSSP